MSRVTLFAWAFVVLASRKNGLRSEEGVLVRVVDVGAGLCCVAKMPGERYMIYDAGNYEDKGATAISAIGEIVPSGADIELLVLSHSDSDHAAAVKWICEKYKVRRAIRPGIARNTTTWKDAVDAIEKEHTDEQCKDINLAYFEFPSGATYRFGEVLVTMVCGFSEPPDDWDIINDSERNNAGSIVRLYYKGKSVLFTGDTVGRHIADPDDACISAEKFMVENSPVIPIKSDVLIAPHHGADNGSSAAFIQAVSPDYVIFSAGHKFDHPRADAAKRYLDSGVSAAKMLRTDRGDDEGAKEWDHERIDGSKDPRGDDDIDIAIDESGNVTVGYRSIAQGPVPRLEPGNSSDLVGFVAISRLLDGEDDLTVVLGKLVSQSPTDLLPGLPLPTPPEPGPGWAKACPVVQPCPSQPQPAGPLPGEAQGLAGDLRS